MGCFGVREQLFLFKIEVLSILFYFKIIVLFINFINLMKQIDLACPNGYFGRMCLETCGKCLADQICNNVNGTCMDGCNKGFKGNLCKKGNC